MLFMVLLRTCHSYKYIIPWCIRNKNKIYYSRIFKPILIHLNNCFNNHLCFWFIFLNHQGYIMSENSEKIRRNVFKLTVFSTQQSKKRYKVAANCRIWEPGTSKCLTFLLHKLVAQLSNSDWWTSCFSCNMKHIL